MGTIRTPAYDHFGTVAWWKDADTVVIDLDRGFEDTSRKVFRLYGIQAPEEGEPGYEEANAFSEAHCPPGERIYLRTYKQRERQPLAGNTNYKEGFGRYLAEIHTPEGEILNELLVKSGHAIAKLY